MKRSWIKLYVEILDDVKLGPLPVWLKWRFVELLLVAAESDENGMLPPVTRLAWRLRVSEEDLLKSLGALSEIGVVCEQGGRWKVTNFEKRQARMEPAERQRLSRSRKESVTQSDKDVTHRIDYATRKVTRRDEKSDIETKKDVTFSSSSSESDSISGSDSEEGEGMGEGDWIPETPAQAGKHPDIQAFQVICGRIPGIRDYALVIETIQLLRARYGAQLVDKVKPCWLAWSTRKTRGGRKYDAASLVWLTEWAVNGEIPHANGSEPTDAGDREKYVKGEFADYVEH